MAFLSLVLEMKASNPEDMDVRVVVEDLTFIQKVVI